jgi:hypothetical protein
MTQIVSRRQAALESFGRTAIQTGIGQAVVLAMAGFVLSRGTGGMSSGDWWLALGAVVVSALAAAVMRWLAPMQTDVAGKHVAGVVPKDPGAGDPEPPI